MRDALAPTLATLAGVFVPLSFLSFGGSNAVLADIAHQAVDVHRALEARIIPRATEAVFV